MRLVGKTGKRLFEYIPFRKDIAIEPQKPITADVGPHQPSRTGDADEIGSRQGKKESKTSQAGFAKTLDEAEYRRENEEDEDDDVQDSHQ